MKLKAIWEKVKDIFSLHCPECNGRMKSEYLDMELDKLVYKCEKCGKKFISYGNKDRKYCCHECYIEDRFGGEY